MASPNIGQTEDSLLEIKSISKETVKKITVVADGSKDSIYSILFGETGDEEKQ